MSRSRAVPAAFAAALLFALHADAIAQDARAREILEEHREGLETGAAKIEQGARRAERAAQHADVEGMLLGTGEVAEGFCTMVATNADAFAELGLDFSGLVGRAGGEENADRYSRAEDACGQARAPVEDFALSGCTDIVVGHRTTLTATAGGTYRFTASRPGVLDVATRGNSATLTAIAPGIATVKAERTDKGRATSSEVVYSLQVKSINDGQPVQVGLYDARGRRIVRAEVPVDVRPGGAARRVVYRSDAGVLTAVGDAGGALTLRPHAPGATQVQAMSACGAPTGAPLQVEVVPCTAGVLADLRTEERRLLQRRDNVLAAIAEVLNDPEFERALRDFEGNATELAFKLAELAIALAAPGERFKEAHTLLEYTADVRNLRAYVSAVLGAGGDAAGQQKVAEVAVGASMDAAAKVAGARAKARGKSSWAGPLNTLLQLAYATMKSARDVGTSVGAAERLKELGIQLDGVVRELEGVWRRMELCKDRRDPQDRRPGPEHPPAAPPSSWSSQPGPRPVPPPGAPPKQAKVVEVADNDAPAGADTDAGPESPVGPPGSPASAAAMASLMFEKQCPGWVPVAQKQAGVFATLAGNMVALGGAYGEPQAQALAPVIERMEGVVQALALFAEANAQTGDAREAGLRQAGELLARHDPDQLAAHAPALYARSVQTQACAGLLRDSFEVKIEELRTRY
ncbi:hypothetical protein B1992_02465 [Pseudoxanthomonas broegbernensis]|uniref:Uncharacterized protein n=1 Tax=Pseudoxanthomonas broegbernensis TaxID=83619 RepID=A0A7V8GP52_9GAMM|nr:hypothetical protein [Pseudoxanthomonas broegbernensis]KAF1687548.1 hypothetical protein B1992_02465 [Pseudoxanthomonas broegbernensis]MBB6064558.1 hypothetical protein [Pseudoxanthomonas broegbernensis]